MSFQVKNYIEAEVCESMKPHPVTIVWECCWVKTSILIVLPSTKLSFFEDWVSVSIPWHPYTVVHGLRILIFFTLDACFECHYITCNIYHK